MPAAVVLAFEFSMESAVLAPACTSGAGPVAGVEVAASADWVMPSAASFFLRQGGRSTVYDTAGWREGATQ